MRYLLITNFNITCLFVVVGQKQDVLRLTVNQDSQPEPAEHYIVRLLPGTITGGARLQHPSDTTLIVLDSDDAHGLVEFGPDSLQTLNTVCPVPNCL